MAGKHQTLMKEYQELLSREGKRSYDRKRAAYHLSKASTIDNLTRHNIPNTASSKTYAEAENIIKLEVKKYGACQSRKKEPAK